MLTPVQKVGPYFLKRDDLWHGEAPAQGGKSRTAALLCERAKELCVEELCICVDRNSSVPGMVSRVCKHYGIKLRMFLPSSSKSLPKVFKEAEANGAELVEVLTGYMSVRRKRARDYVERSSGKAVLVNVGLLWDGIGTAETAEQAANVCKLIDSGEVKRIVVPVGSGGMLKGIVLGLTPRCLPVIGVCCGNPPKMDWSATHVKLVQSSFKFDEDIKGAELGAVALDPTYEAKCLEFLEEGDLLWIVAHRDTE